MGMALLAIAIALANAAPVVEGSANQPAAEPLRIVIPVIETGCPGPKSGDDVIVVCGRDDRRYRIDPAVLAVTRARNAKGSRPRPDRRTTLFQETCGPIGSAHYPGQGTLPVSSIALTVATALIKVAKGEDLRPMLLTTPSEYGMYQQAKAAEDANKPQMSPAPE